MDKYGRKKVFLLAMIFTAICHLILVVFNTNNGSDFKTIQIIFYVTFFIMGAASGFRVNIGYNFLFEIFPTSS